ncbi:MAG TPA: DUF3160 domain-containing protein, partial [Myxococcales bacterium]|nr:DUF3160 domain-containing protein [Myxococcales bacterium]
WLSTNPLSSEATPLPLSFTVMGQRFIVDSYVFSNVVYDNIVHKGTKVPRALPSSLDAMFVLGSNEAGKLLKDELDTYNYASNLHALRFLVDGYGEDFWSENVYNMWLTTLRSMNHLSDSESVPAPMRTEAWSHKVLNTQLASWAELRHDTLLYAKQSYTGGIGCEYPDGYVEPYPEAYRTLGAVATRLEENLTGLETQNPWLTTRLLEWASTWRSTMAHLESMANKELKDEPFNEVEIALFKQWIKKPEEMTCGGPSFTGRFPALYLNEMHAEEFDPIIADVHTNPNDDAPLGPARVLHVGTGKANLMILTRQSCEGTRAYAGPVSSFYEHAKLGMDRLTDEEWKAKFSANEQPARPSWTSSYLITNN